MKSQSEKDHERSKIVEAALAQMTKITKPEDESELERLRLRANEIVAIVRQENDIKYSQTLIGGGMDVAELSRSTSKLFAEHLHKWTKEELLLLHVMIYTMNEVMRVSGKNAGNKNIAP